MCARVCVSVLTCVFGRVRTRTHVCVYVCVCLCVYVSVFVLRCVCVRARVCVRVRMQLCVREGVYVCVVCVGVDMGGGGGHTSEGGAHCVQQSYDCVCGGWGG